MLCKAHLTKAPLTNTPNKYYDTYSKTKDKIGPTMPTITPVPVAWECADCTCTNEGIEPGLCRGCWADDPIRYMIWMRQEGLPAPTAISA